MIQFAGKSVLELREDLKMKLPFRKFDAVLILKGRRNFGLAKNETDALTQTRPEGSISNGIIVYDYQVAGSSHSQRPCMTQLRILSQYR